MQKLIAILNVVAWAGFWAFGYIALTGSADGSSTLIALLLAAAGGAVGIWAYLHLVRHSEATGYAKTPNRADRSHLEQDYNEEAAR